MGTMVNPGNRFTRPQQAALYYARRRRLASTILNKLTPWAKGLNITAGHYVSGDNGHSAFLALTSGTAGNTAPTGQGPQSDGTVNYTRVDIMSLLQFLYTGVPTP